MPKTKVKAYRFETQRAALLKKQKEMVDTYQRDRAAGNEQPEDGIQDLADKAATAYSKELNFSLSDSDRETLMLVDDALARMAKSQYGNCSNCGN